MKKVIFLIGVTILLLSYWHPAFSSNLKGGENVAITEPVEGNLYVAGGKVRIQAKISGDLVVAGGDIVITDSILQDVLIAGGNITVDGVTGEDLRIMGGSIKILNNVLGDLVIAGGDVEVANGVTILGDFVVGGGSIRMEGLVKGKTIIAGGETVFNGIAEGEVEIRAGKLEINGELYSPSKLVAGDLKIGSRARFFEDVTYYNSKGEVSFDGLLFNDARANFDPDLQSEYEGYGGWKGLRRAFWGFFLYRLLAAAALIVLLVALFNSFFAGTPESLKNKYFNNLGIGVLYVLAVPALIVVACLTIIGIPAALMVGGLFGITIALGHILAAILTTHVWQNYSGKNWGKGKVMLIAMGVYFILKLLSLIPFLGWLISAVVTLAAFGTIIQYFRDQRKSREDAATEGEVEVL